MLGRSRRRELESLYEEVLSSHGASLRRVVGSYEADPDRAEDLFQEICLALWRALPTFRAESSLRTFVFRIAHNRGLSHGWREAKAPDPTDELHELIDRRPGPEARAESRQKSALLYAAIRQLPLLSRQVLTLRLEGLTYREISEVMGETENSVTVRASRARKTLRRILEDDSTPRQESDG